MTHAERIRVLHLGSPTGIYGAERWILALAKHLPPDQVDSVIGTIQDLPGETPQLCRHAAKLGFQTTTIEALGRVNLQAISRLRESIRDLAIDVVHTHGYKTDLIGAFAVRGTNSLIVSTPHGWSHKAGLNLRIYEALDRVAFAFHDATVPLSEDLYHGLRNLPWLGQKLHLILNGVDVSEIDNVDGTTPELSRLQAQGKTIIGYIGQLIPRKGLDVLLLAFERSGLEDSHLCIVGEGPERARLEMQAHALGLDERVTFFGYREDRLDFLAGFDVFVLPSTLEGIPRCLMEAMTARVAVVATDIPGCRDIVADGVTGLLFPPGDVDALAHHLEALVTRPALKSSLETAGSELVRSEFSAELMAGRYLSLYRDLLRGRG